MSNATSLDKDPIPSLFFKYYTPILVSLLSMTVHQVINGIILGQYVGKEGIAAVGLYGPVFTIFISCALALMIGGGILIAKNIGAKNYEHAQEVFQFATTIALIFGGIVAICSPFLTKPTANFLAGSENAAIVETTSSYIFWAFLWLPFFFLSMLWGNFVRNDGAPKVSRNASLFAVGLNILLDILLVIVFPFGTAGASIATGISVLGGVVYLFVYINRGKGYLRIKGFRFTLRLKEWKELLKAGLPSFVSEISFALGLLLINKSLIPFGALAIAAFGMVNHLSFIFLRLFTAAMISTLSIIPFNIGAGLPKRVLEMLRFSMIFTFLLGGLVTLIGWLCGSFFVTAFAGNNSNDFREIATNATGLYFILFIAAGPNYILGAYLQSIGKSAMSIVINLLKGVVFIGLFLLILPGFFGMGLNGIWLSRAFTEAFALLVMGLFTFYKWGDFYSDAAILSKNKK